MEWKVLNCVDSGAVLTSLLETAVSSKDMDSSTPKGIHTAKVVTVFGPTWHDPLMGQKVGNGRVDNGNHRKNLVGQ